MSLGLLFIFFFTEKGLKTKFIFTNSGLSFCSTTPYVLSSAGYCCSIPSGWHPICRGDCARLMIFDLNLLRGFPEEDVMNQKYLK